MTTAKMRLVYPITGPYMAKLHNQLLFIGSENEAVEKCQFTVKVKHSVQAIIK